MKIATSVAVLAVSAVSAFVPVTRRSVAAKPLASVIDINENAERDLGTMDEWATACGVQKIGGFQLTTEDGRDFSVMTTEPLEEGSPLLYIPSGMILTTSKAREELRQMGSIQDAVDQLNRLGANDQVPRFYLYIKILVEYERGDQSPWFPWLNAMPRLYFNAVSMTDFCYECLPPLVFALSRAERVKADNFFDVLQKVDFLSPATKSNKELSNWAYNIVTTRCWGPDDDKQIIPMADMFNHGTETEVAINIDESGDCTAFSTTDVSAGSPLRMSYGCPTNPSHFFATYGFLDETAPATFCKIMNIKPNQELLDLGYDFSRMLFYKDTGDISEEVWDIMLYQVLASDRDTQQVFYQAHMNGDADTKSAIHQHYFGETAMALQNHCDTFLKLLDELSSKADGKDVNEHPRLPLILAHNDFVRNTFLAVKANLDPMVEEAVGEPAYM